MSDRASETIAAESILAELVEEYLERLERREQPDVEQYVARWPGDARILRQTFAALRLTRLSSVAAVAEQALATAACERKLGEFRLLGELGRGGMGVVYEAEQVSLERRVALKILPFAGVLDPRQLQRFKNEALAAAQLSHPNIVDIIAVGCERGVHFYAMRLVDGPTLAEVIASYRSSHGRSSSHAARERMHHAQRHIYDTPSVQRLKGGEVESSPRALTPALSKRERETGTALPDRVSQNPKSTLPGLSTESPCEYYRGVARLMAEVAAALDYAHQQGIVHRDVKPSNILLDGRGKPWVTDFGLARLEAGGDLTMTGDLLGTLRYMSPEQASGDRRMVDHRTDIYSLGATLYELLTLRPAFAADDRQKLLRRIAQEPPRSPRRLVRTLPVELETIVLKALDKNPAERYATAGKLADDLQRFLDYRPIHARRSRVMAHVKSIWRRHQVLFVAVLVTLLVASSIASVFVWRQRQEAVTQHALVVERESDLRQRLYATDMKLAHQAWQRGDVARVQELVDRYAGTGNDDLRDFAWHYLSSLLAARPAPLAVLRPGHGSIYCVQFSPDGKHLAAACGDGHVDLWNVADWSLRHSLAAHHQADADCVAFSPDGKLLASGGEDGWLRLWDVESGELIRSLGAGQKDTLTVAISPDGRTLAAGGIDGLVRFWQLPEGERRGEYRASAGRVQHLAFSPDGGKLATAGGDGNALVLDTTTNKRLFSLPSLSTAVFGVAFSAGGDRVAIASGSGLVAIADASSGVAECLLGVRHKEARSVGFSSTRPLLASAGQPGVVDLWDTASRSLLAKFNANSQRIWSICFSADGSLLASAGGDGNICIWNPEIESGAAKVDESDPFYAAKFTADSQRLLAVTDNQELVEWDTATANRLSARPLPRVERDVVLSREQVLHALYAAALPRTQKHEMVVSPDRRRIAVRTCEGEVWLGEAAGGALTRFDPGLAAPIYKVALGGRGRLMLWYADGALEVWDTAARKLLDRRQLAYHPGAWPTSSSSDGRFVVETGTLDSRRAILVYDLEALTPRFIREDALNAVAISPDNRWLASANSDGLILLFDTASGEHVGSLTGHQHYADSLAFSPDGRVLASAGHGGSVRLWHLATREELFTVRRFDSNSHVQIDFSPDGRRLAASTGGRDGHGHLYVWSAFDLGF